MLSIIGIVAPLAMTGGYDDSADSDIRRDVLCNASLAMAEEVL
jgi:hypothetical protein